MNAIVYAGLNLHSQKRFKDSLVRKRTLSSIETIPEIIKAASLCFNIDQSELTGKSRTDELVKVRILIVKTIRSKFEKIPLKTIGCYLNKDHSTIIYLLARYATYSKHDTKFQDMVIKFTKYRYSI